jgi:hypothetical protein
LLTGNSFPFLEFNVKEKQNRFVERRRSATLGGVDSESSTQQHQAHYASYLIFLDPVSLGRLMATTRIRWPLLSTRGLLPKDLSIDIAHESLWGFGRFV